MTKSLRGHYSGFCKKIEGLFDIAAVKMLD